MRKSRGNCLCFCADYELILVDFDSEQFFDWFFDRISGVSMTVVIIILFPMIPIIVEWFIFLEILPIMSSDDRFPLASLPSFYDF